MTTDQNQPTSTPNETDENNSRQKAAQPNAPASSSEAAAPDQAARTQTQGNMGDGAGQRGGYGDSDQPNGMEGGPESAQQGTPQGGQNEQDV